MLKVKVSVTMFNFFSVPWLIPILQSSEVAKAIVNAVRMNQDMLILPKIFNAITIKRYTCISLVYFNRFLFKLFFFYLNFGDYFVHRIAYY